VHSTVARVRTSPAGTQASRPTIQLCGSRSDPRLSIALLQNSQESISIGIVIGRSSHRHSPRKTSIHAGCSGFAGTTKAALCRQLADK
jgi:hypothetical protein